MLSLLHIENIAVIECADISFDAGFNILTGETGAGKSIVIDAISTVMGERAYRDMIRTGMEKASVRGIFTGVYVVSVLEGSAAEAAGMVMGDVIVNFDGDKISGFQDLQSVLQYYAVGDTAKVTVMRPVNGEYKEVELQITMGEKPETDN